MTDVEINPSPDIDTDVFAAFGDVEETNTATVEISGEERAAFDAAVEYFAARTNRHQLTVTKPDERAAKKFYRQVNQYADEHGLSTLPKRSGNQVTFRFSPPRPRSNGAINNQDGSYASAP